MISELDTRTHILTAIEALKTALRNLPVEHLDAEIEADMAQLIASLPHPIPARKVNRLLAQTFSVSQRQCPAILASLGYQRVKKESGFHWVKTATISSPDLLQPAQ